MPMADQSGQQSSSLAALKIHRHPKQWTARDTRATEVLYGGGANPVFANRALFCTIKHTDGRSGHASVRQSESECLAPLAPTPFAAPIDRHFSVPPAVAQASVLAQSPQPGRLALIV